MIYELTKETDINKLLKYQKETGAKIKLLFHSLWDPWSETLVNTIKEKYTKDIYLINSFDTPHAYVIYKLTTAPTLVTLKAKSVKIEDKLPAIYYELGLKDLPSV